MSLNTNDRNRLGQIFDDYYDRVYTFLYFRVKNTALTEELASDTFLKVVEKYKTYNPEKGALSTWIFTIAMNQLRSNYRSFKGKEPINLEDIENLSGGADTEACLEANETKTAILRLLNELDERQHSIITLKYYGGLSNKEISDIMKISETNVSTMLNRAIKKLRNILEKRDEFSDFAYKSQEGKR